MTVLGIGIDIAKNESFEWFLNNPSALKKILSYSEILRIPASNNEAIEYLACAFACKEAIIKASESLTVADLPLIVIVQVKSPCPKVDFNSLASPRIEAEKKKNWLLGVTLKLDYVMATAIAQI